MLSDIQKQMLNQSWNALAPMQDEAADLFYDKLFQLEPGYRRFFPDDMRAQKRKLTATLAFIVESTVWPMSQWQDDVPTERDLTVVLLALGRRHGSTYRIPDASYAVVREALMWSLDRCLGDDFSDDVREVWTRVYDSVASMMMMGSKHAARGATGESCTP